MTQQVLWGLGGAIGLMAIAWAFSVNRKKIQWRVVFWGVVLQIAFAGLILKTNAGKVVFEFARDLISGLLQFTDKGAGFLFGNLYKGFAGGPYQVYDSSQGMNVPIGIVFAFHVLMTIVFFGALMSVLYHIGFMQLLVAGIAKVMRFFMRTSGAETLSCAANIFVGQTEAPLVVKPFLERATKSELMAIMVGGFATVAGGVMAAYARFGIDPGHLLAASVMSAPAALVFAKLMYPEDGEPETSGTMPVKFEKTSENTIDAAANGASDGMKLAINVAAMLMAFISLIAMLDWGLGLLKLAAVPVRGLVIGEAVLAIGLVAAAAMTKRPLLWVLSGVAGLHLGSVLLTYPGLQGAVDLGGLSKLLGYVCLPISYLMGVDPKNAVSVGQVVGIKTGINEFVGYITMADMRETMSPRAFDLATYALCGFSNFSSIAIQIGGISAIAPSRRGDLARLGLRAMVAGSFACFQTAAIAGMFITDADSAAKRADFKAGWMTSSLDYQKKIDVYDKFIADYPQTEFAQQAAARIKALRGEAKTTYASMKATALRLEREGKIAEAKAIFKRVIDEFTTPAHVEQYRESMGMINLYADPQTQEHDAKAAAELARRLVGSIAAATEVIVPGEVIIDHGPTGDLKKDEATLRTFALEVHVLDATTELNRLDVGVSR